MKSLFRAAFLTLVLSLILTAILPCVLSAKDADISIASDSMSFRQVCREYTREPETLKEVTVTAGCGLNTRTGTGTNKIAYLTFDDGPSSNNTPRILETLKKYDIKATFFVNGNGKKDLYKKIADEGHVIGNHTYSHNYKTIYSSIGSFKKDVERLNDFLEEITGKRPEILRFPGGSNNTVSHKYGGRKIMKELCPVVCNSMEYQYFDWNVSSEDATVYRAGKDFIVRSALKGAKHTEQAIILMHDSALKTTTADALPEIIEGLIGMGFKFEVLTKDTPAIQFVEP